MSIERLQFADVNVALDLGTTQPGGQAALLVGAVLGVGAVMRLDVWGVLANGGAASASNAQIASYLLTTVNGHAPDAATLTAAVTALNTETGDAQGNFLWHLAESAANQTQIGLVGLAETGLEFGGT